MNSVASSLMGFGFGNRGRRWSLQLMIAPIESVKSHAKVFVTTRLLPTPPYQEEELKCYLNPEKISLTPSPDKSWGGVVAINYILVAKVGKLHRINTKHKQQRSVLKNISSRYCCKITENNKS